MAAKIVDESSIVSAMIHLLSSAPSVLQENAKGANASSCKLASTPKWMTPLLLFIDLYEKVILGMNRRGALQPVRKLLEICLYKIPLLMNNIFQICAHTWKWFDVSSGKWCLYAQPNNKTIDEAFWAGESSVRIQNGRKKYTIQFGKMEQVNEESANRRPVMISLAEASKPKIPEDKTGETADQEMQDLDEKSEESKVTMSQLPKLKKLSEGECSTLLHACVSLMGSNVDADALNAILRLLLRLTQDFEQAVVFASLGGVKMLLDLTQASSFSGFCHLAALLIRHVMEDPQTLRATMEKVIRSSTVQPGASNNYKELHYLLSKMAPAACRNPDLFAQVARETLRVDFNLLKKTGDIEEDKRLLLKSLPAKSAQPQGQPLHEVSRSVICDLLNFLVRAPPPELISSEANKAKPEDSMNNVNKPSSASAASSGTSHMSGANRTQQVIVRNSSSIELQVSVPEGAVPPESAKNDDQKPTDKTTEASTDEEVASKKRPLMTKASVCKLLAELVKSYGSCATLITEHVFEAGMSELVKEDTTALAFLLDELLVSKNTDKECSSLIKILVAALSSCNHFPEAQATLVLEVKGAFARALALQESNDKHNKIQALAGLICTMIESCPSTQSHQTSPLAYVRNLQQSNMNNMVKVMLKKGIITDLARVTHNLDLSSPNVAATINAVLKPLETLSRIVNQPRHDALTGAQRQKSKAANGANGAANNDEANANPNAESGNNESAQGNNGTNTTNSEATRAQGDETVGEPDPEATEHDISTAAESIDPNSESQLHTVEEGNDEEFEDMMDQLLERDGAGGADIIAEAIDHHMNTSGLDSTLDDTQHDSQVRF